VGTLTMTWLLLDALPQAEIWPDGLIEALRHRAGDIQPFLNACGSGKIWEGIMVAGNEDVVSEVVRGVQTAFAQDAGRLLASTHFCLLPDTPGTAPLDDPRNFIERMAAQGARVVRLPGSNPDGVRDAIIGITSGTAPMGAEADVPDYYTLLGLPETGSAAELATAIDNYRSFWRNRVDHPTVRDDALAALALLDNAAAELMDPGVRKAYDTRLSLARERAGNKLVVPKVQPVSLQRPPESFTGHGWSKTAGVGSRTDRLDKMAARHDIKRRANEKGDPDAPLEGFENSNLAPTFHLPGLGFRWRSKDHEDMWPPVETPEGWIPLDDPVLIENAIRYGGMIPVPQVKAGTPILPADLEDVLQALAPPEPDPLPVAPPPVPLPEPPRPEAQAPLPPASLKSPTLPEVEIEAILPDVDLPAADEAPQDRGWTILPVPDKPVFVLEASQLEVLDLLEEPEDLLKRFLNEEMPFPTLDELVPESLRAHMPATDAEDDVEEEGEDFFPPVHPFEDTPGPDTDTVPGEGPNVYPVPDDLSVAPAVQDAEEVPEEVLLETLTRLEHDPELDALFKRFGTGPLDPSVAPPAAPSTVGNPGPWPGSDPEVAAEDVWEGPTEDVSALRAILGSAPDDVLNPVRAATPEPVRYAIDESEAPLGIAADTASGTPTDETPLVPLPETALSRFRSLEMLFGDHRISIPEDLAWPVEGEAALLGDCAWGPEGQSTHRITAVVPVGRIAPADLERLKELGLIGWMLPGTLRQVTKRLESLDPLPYDAPALAGPTPAFAGLDDDQDELLMKLLAEEGYDGPIEAAPAERGLLEDDGDTAEGRALLEDADLDDEDDYTAHGNMAVRRSGGGTGPVAATKGRKDPKLWRNPLRWWRTRVVRRQRDQAMSILPALVPEGHRPLVLAYDGARGRARFALKTARRLESLTPPLLLPGLRPALDHLSPLGQFRQRTAGRMAGSAAALALLLGPALQDAVRGVLPSWPEPRATTLEVQMADAPAGTLLSWKEELDQVVVLRSVDSDQDAHWVMISNISAPGPRYLVDPWPLDHPGRYRYLVSGVRWTRPWAPWADKSRPDRQRAYRTWLSDVLRHHDH
jgi:hypothetical protein